MFSPFRKQEVGSVQKSCFQYYYTENSLWVQSFLPPVLYRCLDVYKRQGLIIVFAVYVDVIQGKLAAMRLNKKAKAE